jgi:hypothetical protein
MVSILLIEFFEGVDDCGIRAKRIGTDKADSSCLLINICI